MMATNKFHSFSFSYLSFSLKEPRRGLVNRTGALSRPMVSVSTESLRIRSWTFSGIPAQIAKVCIRATAVLPQYTNSVIYSYYFAYLCMCPPAFLCLWASNRAGLIANID